MMEYRGWTYQDHGENYHPITARWQAVRFGVWENRRTEEQLKVAIDERIKQYPSSGGA